MLNDTFRRIQNEKKWVVLGALLISLFLNVKNVGAQENSFSIHPIISDAEIQKNGNFFQLDERMGQSEIKQVEVSNHANQELKLILKVNNATTNDNGSAAYDVDEKPDVSLKMPLTQFVSMPKEITLAPYEKRKVSIKVTYPKGTFDGVISGALNFFTAFSDGNQDSVAIASRYGYTIGLIIRGDKLKTLKPLEISRTQLKLINGNAAIVIQLHNQNAAYLNQMHVKAMLVNQSDSDISYQNVKSDLQFSPNSTYNHVIGLPGRKIVPGIYKLSVDVKTNQGKWRLKKKVRITKTTADLLNRNDLTQMRARAMRQKILFIVASVVGTGFLVHLFWVRKKQRGKNEEKN